MESCQFTNSIDSELGNNINTILNNIIKIQWPNNKKINDDVYSFANIIKNTNENLFIGYIALIDKENVPK